MNVLELYSGIGGMHLALKGIGLVLYINSVKLLCNFAESNVSGKVIAAIDINTTANTVYEYNFPDTKLYNRNIQSISAEFVNRLNIDTILMSPPCQPFTRNGLKQDIDDPRTSSFIHVLDLLPKITAENMLIENVKGFELSEMRSRLIEKLNEVGYNFQEFMLTPTQFGVPNSRCRYYCIARKFPHKLCFETGLLVCYYYY